MSRAFGPPLCMKMLWGIPLLDKEWVRQPTDCLVRFVPYPTAP